MMQIIKQSDEQKLKMYLKLSKKQLAIMLIESNKKSTKTIAYTPSPIKTYADIYHCNPKNGGSGICECTLGGIVTTYC